MEFYIYDLHRNKIGVVQSYTSLQWQKCYYDKGEFLLSLNETLENLINYKIGYVIHKSDDNTLGYVESVTCGDGKVEVRGHLDNLANRINYATASIADVEKDVYNLINQNKRNLEITTAPVVGLNSKIAQTETTYNPLGETIVNVCKLSGLGYRVTKKGDTFGYFELYRGAPNDGGILSEEFNNLYVKEYMKDISKYKNYAIVAGEGDGANRKIVYVDRTNGKQRYELYVDARDLQKTYKDAAGNDRTYTDAEYNNVLVQRGNQKLDDVKTTESFKVDYDVTNESFKYGRDWGLGDIVKTKSTHYGFIKQMRATKIKEVYETDYKVVATLEEVII